jgi:hypothetical protein
VIRSLSFLEYAEMYRGMNDQWERAIEAFVLAYPSLVEKAQLRLNTLFDREGLPDAGDVMRAASR